MNIKLHHVYYSVMTLLVVVSTYILVAVTGDAQDAVARMRVNAAVAASVDSSLQRQLQLMGINIGYSQPGDSALIGGNCFLQIEPFINGGHVIPSRESSGINPTLACRLVPLLRDYSCLKITSGFRSIAEQTKLCGPNGKPSGCARPGRSCHQYGLAVDVGGCAQRVRNVLGTRRANKYGLHFPYSGMHIQCIENSVAACSPDTKPCGSAQAVGPSGNNPGAPGTVTAQSNRYAQYQPISTVSQVPQRYQVPPSVAPPNQVQRPYSPYDIVSVSPRQVRQPKGTAQILCRSGKVEWECSGDSTKSRVGVTDRRFLISTYGELSGQVDVDINADVTYKLQCLSGDRVLDEAVCSNN